MKISARVVDGSSVCTAVLASCRPVTLHRVATTTQSALSARRNISTAGEATAEQQQTRQQQQPQNGGRRQLGGGTFFCPRTSQWLSSTFSAAPGTDSAKTTTCPSSTTTRRHAAYTTTTARKPMAATVSHDDEYIHDQHQHQQPVRDKGELLSYVPLEDQGSVDEHFDFYRDPYRRGYAQPDGPKLQVSETPMDVEYPRRDEVYAGSEQVRADVTRLCSAISLKMRHPHRSTLEAVYGMYTALPEPRMLNLTGQWRHRLLRIMGTPPRRNRASMMRYFGLVGDVRSAGLTLRRTEWNYALAFATKWTAQAGTHEVDAALRMWRDMERGARVPANDVTFNVLFDVAAKAGNFALAEMLYNEMDSRGIAFNRFHHVSLMHFFGLRLDSAGIRAAYREMVEAGEMIDTVALNCVIAGFLRCGEEAAAEETYRRMRTGAAPSADMPERDYMMAKVVSRVLMMFSKVGREHPQLKESLQHKVERAPDLRTYRILVDHYAVKLGDLPKVARYLDEMRFQRVPVHPTIFLALFKGFYLHGGFRGSQWSRARLENVLKAIYDAADEAKGAGAAGDFRIDRWVAIWALRAVAKCADNEAVFETFDQLAARWHLSADSEPFMHALLENIVSGRDLKAKGADKTGTLHRGYHIKKTVGVEDDIPY